MRAAHGGRRRPGADAAVLPHPLRGRRDLRLRRRSRRHAHRGRAVLAWGCGRLRALHGALAGDLRGRVRAARPRALRLGLRHAADHARSRASRRAPQRLRRGGEPHPRRAPADDLQLPPAPHRRQPVPGERDLLPHRPSRTALGRAFRARRHRPPGGRAGRADPGAGRVAPLRRGGVAHPGGERCRHRRRPGLGRAHRRRHRRLQRRFRLHPPHPPARGRAAALDRPPARPVAFLHGPVRLVFRHEPDVSGHRPPHHPDGAALSRAHRRHLPAQGPVEGFQPLPASPHRHRSAPGAARLRCVLRALPGAQPRRRPGLGGGGGALSPRHRAAISTPP